MYKTECVKIEGPFRTVDELELATLSRVHWFTEKRLHPSLDYLTSLAAEKTPPGRTRGPGDVAVH